MIKAITKARAAMGLLLSVTILGISGCGATMPPSLPYDSIRLMAKPFALRSNDVLLEQRLCANSNLLMRDCETVARSQFRMKDNVRNNVYDKLSDKLFAAGATSSKKARWRLRRDRVEWQYKF